MDLAKLLKTRAAVVLLAVGTATSAWAGKPEQRYTAEQYIEMWKEVAVQKMKEHGIPASITLAQGLLESGNGNSMLAREANNHFGIKCHSDWTGPRVYHDDDRKNDCFRKYKDAAQSFEDHSKFLMRPRYAALFELKPTDYKGWAHGLRKAGYATDPNYPKKLIDLIERYRLHDLDKGIDVAYRKPETGNARPVTGKPPTKPRGRNTVGGDVIVIGAGRQVESFEGRIKFVRAKAGDDLRKLANDLEMTHGMLARWNDMDKNAPLSEGQIVFIQPKRNTAKTATTHTVAAGESLWDISQRYGVKLAKLEKYNGVAKDTPLSAGQQVQLRKPKR
jgi:hypothetical protein